MIDLPSLGLVIGSATISAINPCSVGILVLLMSAVLGRNDKKNSSRHLLGYGLTFLFTFLITYLVLGAVLVYLFGVSSASTLGYVSIALAVLLMLGGILEIKDYFWYGQGPSLRVPKRLADLIHSRSTAKKSSGSFMLLGILAAIALVPCAGGPYVATLALLTPDFGASAYTLMAVYALLLVIPLAVVLIAVVIGSKVSEVSRWKEESKDRMRLFVGLLMVVLSWLLMLSLNGAINFG